VWLNNKSKIFESEIIDAFGDNFGFSVFLFLSNDFVALDFRGD